MVFSLSFILVYIFVFFKQKTAYEMRISDWSSDVCSSDLLRSRKPRAPDRERSVGCHRPSHARGKCLADPRRARSGHSYRRGGGGWAHSAALDRKSTRLNSSH